MKNNFIKSENFTKWAIRKVSVGVVSAAIASGIFIVVGSGEAHASDLQDKAPVVQNVENKQVDDATESKVIENKVNTVGKETKQVEKSTVEAKNVVSAEKQPEVKSEKEVSIESKETDVNNLIKQAKDVAEPQTTPVEVKKAVMENTKDTVDVQAKYLDKANFPGPFTAGVNQVIPYEFFGGDGMLTRLILKSSDKASWSDNGSAKNPALLPLEKLGKGLYFYEVDLEGTKGKSDKELLDLLKANGTQSYKATIKVYGEKDGKADLTNVVATKDVNVNLNGLTSVNEVKKAVMENTKDTVDVQAKYLDKANFPGPFTAGVNQVIPYEFFGGDGMLTRLILKSSDKASWSDNGSAKNPALLPLEKLGKGLYFYEVDLEGTKGKSDKELLDLLKANGTQSYKATIKVYGEKDGKADLTNVVATKEVTINLHKETKQMDMKPEEDMMQNNTATGSMNSNVSEKVMNMSKSDNMSMKSSMNKAMMPENMTMDSHMNKDMMQDNMTMNTHMSNGMTKKGMLPKTSAAPEGTMSSTNSSNTGILGLIIASFLGILGFRRKNN
ncbi:SSURE domain-containing protein [Gemella sanguinis]|uniref:YSIRK signal domain/LPXTG anchor domain surface protein n=1 Tax=Gemella sanguinis TaxID=84135 RepID=A0A2N6SCW5_9BACL|nr:fibronectin-binding SSURE repeat-containing protein [Gemella sanguinis]PMC51737.1 YSIRK signal domain/LPXTG anchor domain surface protein [Gemella sanguinis]